MPALINNVVQPGRKLFSLLLLLCLFTKTHAQEEEPVVDTTIVAEEADDYEETDDDSPVYFTRTWMYDTDSIWLKRLPDNVVNDWKKDKEFWYADSVFRSTADRQSQEMNNPSPQEENSRERNRPRQQEYKSAAASPFVQTLLLGIVIAGFAGFIIYYLVSNKGMFKKQKTLATDETVEEETEDIFAISYQKEIDKAAAAGNYRYAIRLQFLRLLKNMAEKNIIQYKQDRTNLDYLMQLSSSPHYNDFFRLTRNYEYSWYGHFEVDAEKYRLVSNDFNNFKPGWS